MSRRRVAVVGAGLGGLTAAGLLARQGCDVTLFEAMGQTGGKASNLEREGIRLDTGPTLLTLPKTVGETFRMLGAEDLLPTFIEVNPQCHYRYHDGSELIVHRSIDRTAESAAQIDPREREGVISYYRHAETIFRTAGVPFLDAPYLSLGKFLARMLRRGIPSIQLGLSLKTLHALSVSHFRTPQLQQFGDRFATYVGASPYRASAAFAMIAHLEQSEGIYHVKGGMTSLAAAIDQAIRRLGVTIHLNCKATWSQTLRGGWQVGPEGDQTRYDALVVNRDPLAGQKNSAAELSLSGHVLLIKIPKQLRLPHHSVFFSENYRQEFDQLLAGQVPSSPTLYLCHPASSDPSMTRSDTHDGAYLMVNAPPRCLTDEEKDLLTERCLNRLVSWIPALQGNLEVLGQRGASDFAALGSPSGSIYGAASHGRLGPFQRPLMKAPQPGLFYAGGGTHPGGGVPMVMLSGRFAAAMVSGHLESQAAA